MQFLFSCIPNKPVADDQFVPTVTKDREPNVTANTFHFFRVLDNVVSMRAKTFCKLIFFYPRN